MKKWSAALVLILVLLLGGSYLFIPRQILVTSFVTANAAQNGVYRFLSDNSNWKKWWPGSSDTDRSAAVFEMNGYRFERDRLLLNAFAMTIKKNDDIDSSHLQLFSLGTDSVKITWNATINTGLNPVSKIRNYFKARELSKELALILISLQQHVNDTKNVYGIPIKKEKVNIEFIVTTKKTFPFYPRTQEIYEMVGRLKSYIKAEKAKEEDYPMLNVRIVDSLHFETQVGIPVNNQLPDKDTFSSKRMLKHGNILVAEVTGGKMVVDSAVSSMNKYVLDYQHSVVAIPFLSLITDRAKMTDSSSWVTKIYFPIR